MGLFDKKVTQNDFEKKMQEVSDRISREAKEAVDSYNKSMERVVVERVKVQENTTESRVYFITYLKDDGSTSFELKYCTGLEEEHNALIEACKEYYGDRLLQLSSNYICSYDVVKFMKPLMHFVKGTMISKEDDNNEKV